MDNSSADILRYYLISQGLGSLPIDDKVWPIYVNQIPDVTDNMILLTDIEGHQDGRNLRTGKKIEHPGIQILVRGIDQPTGFKKTSAIANAVDTCLRQTVITPDGSYLIQAITRKGGLIPLGMEQHYKILERQEKEVKRRRFMWVSNTIITVSQQ